MTSPDEGPFVVAKPNTFNRYAYAGLDPINHVDPSGNSIEFMWSNGCGAGQIVYGSGCMDPFDFPAWISPGWLPYAHMFGYEVPTGGGGGGAVVPDFAQKAEDALTEARRKLANVIGDCQGIFDAFSRMVPNGNVLGRLRDIMGGGNLRFIDGTTAQNTIGQLFPDGINGVSPAATVEQIFFAGLPNANGRLTSIDGLSAPGGSIFFRESGINWQNMVHEILHQVSPALSDFNMLIALSGLDPKRKIDTAGSSRQISDFIKDKCK
jgi:hypothetical protein